MILNRVISSTNSEIGVFFGVYFRKVIKALFIITLCVSFCSYVEKNSRTDTNKELNIEGNSDACISIILNKFGVLFYLKDMYSSTQVTHSKNFEYPFYKISEKLEVGANGRHCIHIQIFLTQILYFTNKTKRIISTEIPRRETWFLKNRIEPRSAVSLQANKSRYFKFLVPYILLYDSMNLVIVLLWQFLILNVIF